MSVQSEYFKSDLRLIVSVHCADVASNDGMNNAFDELNIALTKIQEKIGAPEHWYFLIDFVAEGMSPTPAEFDPNEPGEFCMGSHNPWQTFFPSFWMHAIKHPQFRRRTIEWIGRLEETFKLAESLALTTDSLWEDDETQFGEPLLTQLALSDVQFVPFYTKLLALWDMSHEVHTGGAVVEIVDRHGITPEIGELILRYTEITGSDDLGLLDYLNRRKG